MIRNAIILGFAFGLLGVNVYVCTQFGYLVSQVKTLKTEVNDLRQTTHDEIASLLAKTASSSATAHKSITSLQEELRKAREAAAAQVGEAKVEATAHAERIANKLAQELATAQQRKLEDSGEQIKSELNKVREAATTADAKISQVHSEVASFKTQIAAEKSQTENQAKDLKRVIGELGVQTDRIATNKQQLEVLRSLGERNYYEFSIGRGQDSIKVSDVRMTLKRADPRRGKFTVELTTADRRFQRKERNANEPIQFYVNKTTPPHELVVNELYELVVNHITKDSIAGYLSTPKVQVVSR